MRFYRKAGFGFLLLFLSFGQNYIYPLKSSILAAPVSLEVPVFTLKRIELQGSSVINLEDIKAIEREYIGKIVNFTDLTEIQEKLTQIYTQKGYRGSLVILPIEDNQNLEQGIVFYRAIEVELEGLDIEGLSHLRESYVRSRLLPYTTKPLNIYRIEEGLQLLSENPLLSNINADLSLGSEPGKGFLSVYLKEAPIWRIGVEGSNEENPTVGEWGAKVELSNRNVFGSGESIETEYKQTEGLERFLVTTSIPLNPQDGNLQISYQLTDAKIISEPFRPLDIRNEAYTVSVSYQQPIVRTPFNTLALGLSVDRRESQSYLLGDLPFSFFLNVRDGRTELTAVRFNQSYRMRDRSNVVWLNSQFSLGFTNLIDDSNFFSWQGQVQWLYPFNEKIRLFSRFSAQLSPNSLPSIEQCAIGGLNGNQFIFGNTVRGYATNTRSGDNCLAASTELWINLVDDRQWGVFSLVPFIDYGFVWNNEGSILSPNTLIGTGVGLRWQVQDTLSIRFDYGIPLNSTLQPELEEQQLNFSIFLGVRF